MSQFVRVVRPKRRYTLEHRSNSKSSCQIASQDCNSSQFSNQTPRSNPFILVMREREVKPKCRMTRPTIWVSLSGPFHHVAMERSRTPVERHSGLRVRRVRRGMGGTITGFTCDLLAPNRSTTKLDFVRGEEAPGLLCWLGNVRQFPARTDSQLSCASATPTPVGMILICSLACFHYPCSMILPILADRVPGTKERQYTMSC